MTEPSRTEMMESQAKGLGALLTSFLTLVLLALGALLIQPRLSERRQLKLRSRRILVLQNPEAADVLADVNPDHWIVPWNDLLSGRITSGNDLCSSSGLKRLCVN